MFIVDFLIAILAPLVAPAADYLLAGVSVQTGVSGSKTNLKKVQKLSIFWKELPSAFIGNAIWGFTYNINSSQTSVWMTIYLFIAIGEVLLLIWANHQNLNISIYKKSLKYISVSLVILTVIRIFLAYRFPSGA